MPYPALVRSIPAVVAIFLAGCTQDHEAWAQIRKLETRVDGLEKQLVDAKSTLNAERMNVVGLTGGQEHLESEVKKLKSAMWNKLETESGAITDPIHKGYAVARNEYGAFPIIVEDAQPYLDGHKVKFSIGNLTSATMTGVKLEIVYGLRDPDFPIPDKSRPKAESAKLWQQVIDAMEQNANKRRIMTVDAVADLYPAKWTNVEAIISPSKPEEIGRLEVRVKISGISLVEPK